MILVLNSEKEDSPQQTKIRAQEYRNTVIIIHDQVSLKLSILLHLVNAMAPSSISTMHASRPSSLRREHQSATHLQPPNHIKERDKSYLDTRPMRQTPPDPHESSRDLIPNARPAPVIVHRSGCGGVVMVVVPAGSSWSGSGGSGGNSSSAGAARETGE